VRCPRIAGDEGMAEDRGACAGAKAPAPLFERVHFLHELDLQDLLGNGCVSVASSACVRRRVARESCPAASSGLSLPLSSRKVWGHPRRMRRERKGN